MAPACNSLTLWMPSIHGSVMLRWQREMEWAGKLKQWWEWWQWLTILTCLDSESRLHFPELMLINKTMIVKMMTRSIMKTMLSGTLATMMTRWKNQHTLGCRKMAQCFLTSLMATWQTLMHPHLECMCQQVAVFKKHTSFCLVSRLPEATFCLVVVGIVAFDGLAQPSTGRKPAKSRGKGKKCKRKGHNSPYKGGQSPNLGTLESCQKHRPRAREFVHQCPRSV